MKSIAATIVLTLMMAVFAINAAEPVTGAFGFKFGEVFDVSKAINTSTNSSGEIIYEVKPELPDRVFQEYHIKITPATHRIYKITAIGNFTSKAAGEKEVKNQWQALEAKFGQRTKSRIPDLPDSIVFPDGYIMVQANKLEKTVTELDASYLNTQIEKEAEKEAADLSREMINGAFGFKFGEIFDLASAIGEPTYAPGSIAYQVRPKTPNDAFRSYEVGITPVTRIIHTITADARYASQSEAESVANALMEKLMQKYGAGNGKPGGPMSVQTGDASVSITVSSKNPGLMWIEYVNAAVKKRGASELPDTRAQLIEGAFGLKFGETPDRSTFTGITSSYGDKASYGIRPPGANDLFQSYLVGLTVPEGKIHSIYASRKFDDSAVAKKEFQTLAAELERKHGLRDSMSKGDTVFFFCKNANITLLYGDYGGQAKLDILYTHNELVKLAEKVGGNAGKPGDIVNKADAGIKPNQIDGAFGLKFGEVFDPNMALEKRPVAAGGFIYVVKPPKPSELFNAYFLVMTPITHKIVGVWANQMFKDQSTALARQAELTPILESKYGKVNEADAQKNKVVIKHEDEYISLETLQGQDGEAAVLIKYHSTKLDRVFFQEMKDEAAGKADKSGL